MARNRKGGAPRHVPTPQLRSQVETLAGLGMRQDDMLPVIGLGSKNTLEKYYRAELDSGMAKARAVVAKTLYQMATSGHDFNATKYWLQQQGGPEWREINYQHIRFDDMREHAAQRARELGLSEDDAAEISAEVEKRARAGRL